MYDVQIFKTDTYDFEIIKEKIYNFNIKIFKTDTYDFEIKKIQIPNSDRMSKFNTTITLNANQDEDVPTGLTVEPRIFKVIDLTPGNDTFNVDVTSDVYEKIILSGGYYFIRLNSGIERHVKLNVLAWAD